MELDPRVQRIIDWRESLAVLPDTHFFEIMRMYLGEVKTPFNKQKLIEELASFLRKEETRKTITNLLSESDIQIISAVKYISGATQEKLNDFFSGSYSFAELYERLLNLEERLLIYRHIEKNTGKMVISVNPHLEADLEPFTPRSVLLVQPEIAEISTEIPMSVTPELLASFMAFVRENSDLTKSDGTFKKKIENSIETIFSGRLQQLFCIAKAFINLSILIENENHYELDKNHFLGFASLKRHTALAYLCVASQGHFSRSELNRQCELLLNVVAAIPKSGYTRSSLLRLSYLISERDNDIPGTVRLGSTSRFSSMLNKYSESQEANTCSSSAMLDRLIENALLLGIFVKKGKNIDGEDIYIPGDVFENKNVIGSDPYSGALKVLSVDAAFTVTILPGLSLEELMPFMQFLSLRQFDTAATFEINKKSLMSGFDDGITKETIFELFEKYSAYELPQNVRVSIEDWGKLYSGVSVYKGYVLQVSEEYANKIQRIPAISSKIIRTFAPGVYLLDAATDFDAETIIRKSGLDCIGKIKTAEKRQAAAYFPEFPVPNLEYKDTDSESNIKETVRTTDEERKIHFDKMRDELKKMEMQKDQYEGLLDRINRKIVLSPVQLRADSVRFERLEAGGMDYAGKVHIVEDAIQNNYMVELEYDDVKNHNPDGILMIGIPLSITKTGLDANLLLSVLPEREEKLLSIGQARHVKRIRGSIFKRI